MEKNMMNGTEIRILGVLCDKGKWKNVSIERRSDREFDINIFGERDIYSNWGFSAWMPLSIISNVDWTSKDIWSLSTVYGSCGYIPAQGHDWSGIRDNSPDTIWKMVDVALKMLGSEVFQQKKIDEVIRTLDIMLSTFETKADLIEWAVKQENSFITRMVAAYIILKDMK